MWVKRARQVVLFFAAGALVGCGDDPPHHSQFLELGTLVSITVRADAETAAQAEKTVREVLREIDADWHPWQAGAALQQINQRLLVRGQAPLPPRLRPLTERAMELSRLSGGVFDPALGGLIKLWGFDDGENLPTAVPDAEALQQWRAAHLPLHEFKLGTEKLIGKPGAQLDFGAIAKGEAAHLAAERLRAQGVRDAIINLGGDVQVLGSRGDRPWRIGVRHPRAEGALAVIDMRDGEAVFTSGDYERYFEHDGRRYHHILDPRTGYPANDLMSVTVLHDDATLADAASTALFVAGEQGWPITARALGLDQVMVVAKTGQVQLTQAMQDRVQIVAEPSPDVVIVKP